MLDSIENYKNRDYFYILSLNIIGNCAIWIQNMMSSIIASNISTTSMMNSIYQAAITIPFFCAFIAGYIGDLYNKKLVVSLSNFLLFLCSIIISFIDFKNESDIYILIILVGLFSTGAVLRMTVTQSLITTVVDTSFLKKASLLNNLGFNISRVIGLASAGYLMSYFSIRNIYMILSILFLFISLIMLKTKINDSSLDKYRNRSKSKGLIHLITYSSLFKIYSIDVFIMFFNGSLIWALLPYIAKSQFGFSSEGQSDLMAILGAGSLSTLFFYSVANKIKVGSSYYLIISLLLPLSMLIISITEDIYFIYISLFVFGLVWNLKVSLLNGEVQFISPKESITKVISLFFMVMYSGQFIGVLFYGVINDVYGINTSFMISGCTLFIGTLLVIFKYKCERKMEYL
ncbi:MFS transporter [Aliivibrio fischeri]|uniref:MFS transporter n=1 Tax=Aliivibrio fischeri TaxID=668 RepID=A0A844P5N5_ALIFS|nr:MFS transporter [Aliivibrio fischeri]MUK64040.1 MFS transporter [Aliivibrio fischeri]